MWAGNRPASSNLALSADFLFARTDTRDAPPALAAAQALHGASLVAHRPQFQTVLVAGATGFVGRALIPALLSRGYSVRGCARHAEPRLSRENLEYVSCDL